jgi:hypothetical protein
MVIAEIRFCADIFLIIEFLPEVAVTACYILKLPAALSQVKLWKPIPTTKMYKLIVDHTKQMFVTLHLGIWKQNELRLGKILMSVIFRSKKLEL